MKQFQQRFDPRDVATLQRIYASIDEPDGLQGIAALQRESMVSQRVLDFENSGDWNAALACYTQMLRSSPPHSPAARAAQTGVLRCLQQLGHFELMLSHSSTLPSAAARAVSLQAAWRLGQWDRIDLLLSTPGRDDFDSCVASALLALSKGEAEVQLHSTHCQKFLEALKLFGEEGIFYSDQLFLPL